ncbi:SDR family oxidoreductase [uncultured Paludibaculum sp.]|uniref:SDR family NAD(P)-dependent oxidoreductase n=1 Tax=uncultured Paludibaculum sp. TaxID=1765020 RepID=UPI002AAB1D16|nr:SDR family oxidoreductase [uncultured Paludibaculum sp.]
MDLQLKGKRAVVTGGTAGIGQAIAAALAEEGAQVFITGRSRASLDRAISEIRSETAPEVEPAGVVADLGTRSGADELFRQVPEADVLVNNLGIYESKGFEEIPDEDWLRIFEVNVLSGVRAARFYLPKMLARNDGRIVFIASESALAVPVDMIHYGMTKAAQLAISRGLAEMTRGTKVTVNTVMPGPTRSAGIVDFIKSVSSQPEAPEGVREREFFEKHRASSLLQRLIEAKEIASLVAYLASPLSAATNGAALRAEGGLLRSIA